MNISAQFDSVPELMEFVDTIAGRQVAKPAAAPEAAAPTSQEPQETEAEVPEIITLVPEPAPAKPRKAKAAPAPAPEPVPAPAPAAPAAPSIGVEIRRIMDATRQRIGDDGSDSALHKAASDAFRQIASVMGVKKPTDIKNAEGVLAFETACSRLERLTDGTVGVPESNVPF